MILVVITGVGVTTPDTTQLAMRTEVPITTGELPKEGVGIVFAKCGHHRHLLAAADNIMVIGECTSAPPDAKRYPTDIDVTATIIQIWEEMMETDVSVEAEPEER